MDKSDLLKIVKVPMIDRGRKRTHRIGLAILGFCALAGTPDTEDYDEMPPSEKAWCQAAAVKVVDGKIIWLQARQAKVEKK